MKMKDTLTETTNTDFLLDVQAAPASASNSHIFNSKNLLIVVVLMGFYCMAGSSALFAASVTNADPYTQNRWGWWWRRKGR